MRRPVGAGTHYHRGEGFLMLSPVCTSAPATNPVTLTEAKSHCRVDHTDDDTLIGLLISAATAHLDGYAGVLGRALVTQTWRQDLESFSDPLRLALGPVASITSVTYYDADNAVQTLAGTVYGLFSDEFGAYLALKPDQTFPSVYSRRDAISVTYVAGVADSAVPAPIKHAILLMVGHWYANREAVAPGQMYDVPMAVDALIRPYRRVGV
jgi:uncharacterized phiE125 gp8 family phage protein